MAKHLEAPIEIYSDDYIKVLCMDEQGAGGAHHLYHVYGIDEDPEDNVPLTVVLFQEGPILEEGVNGGTNEALLAIVEHRLNSFQKGPFPSHYNHAALGGVEFAKTCLWARTEDRKNRNVEGKSKA